MKRIVSTGLAATMMMLLVTTPAIAAPLAPVNLAATPVSPTQINLTWASTTDVTVVSFAIYRNGGVSPIATTSASATGYNDTGLAPLTLYTYVVRTFDASSTGSSDASVATTTLADTQAPSVPTGLVATPMSPTQINLTWASSTDNVAVTGYQVFRNGVQIATTTVPSYSNTGLTASTSYNYTVASFDASNNFSLQSSPVTATTPAVDTVAPSIPTGLTATAVSSSQINLVWAASTDNVAVAGYRVYRNSGASPVATTTAASFADTGLIASTTYSYAVAAFDASGNASAQSSSTSATTLAAGTTTPPTSTTTAQIKVVGNEGVGRVINLRSNAKIKVVVFGGTSFNVQDIDPKTVSFAGAPAVNHWKTKYNRDRIADRVFEFRARDMKDFSFASSTATSTNRIVAATAVFKAKTVGGQTIELSTAVRIKNLKAWNINEMKRRAEEKRREELKERREKERELKKKEQERLREAAEHAKESIKAIKSEVKQQIKEVKQQLKETKNQGKQNSGKKNKNDD